jgi:type I restriction enzyme S subunit
MSSVPPSPEQQRIIAKVERRLSVVGELKKQVEADLRRAERLRQAILKHAFAGRLVPQDPNDEPASELLARIQTERRANQSQRRGAVAVPKATQPWLPRM